MRSKGILTNVVNTKWGNIPGDIEEQEDLIELIDSKDEQYESLVRSEEDARKDADLKEAEIRAAAIKAEETRAKKREDEIEAEIGESSSALTEEVLRAKTAESALSEKIKNETIRARGKEDSLNESIINETSRSVSAEADLNTEIASVSNNLVETENKLKSELAEESFSLRKKIADLNDVMDERLDVDEANIAKLNTSIENEKYVRENEDKKLANAISKEEIVRQNADEELTLKITKEEDERQRQDNKLRDDLNSEKMDRESCEKALSDKIENHIRAKDNPHEVTKEQVGLSNVDNTADVNKPISTATQAALDEKINLLGNEQVSGEPYHFPFFYDAVIDGQKLKVAIHTITLDNNKTITRYNKELDLPGIDLSEVGYRCDLEMDSSTYVLTPKLYNKAGTLISTGAAVDLPLESVIVNGRYDAASKKLILTLKNGTEIEIPLGDLVAGLVSTTDFIAHVNNNVVHTTAEEKEKWNAKVDQLGNEAGSGEPYNFTYFYELLPAADKAKVIAHTITLDNNKTIKQFDLEVPAATETLAGLMSAQDKKKLDTSVQPEAIKDMASKTWVNEQGFLKEHQSLVEYAKTADVNKAIAGEAKLRADNDTELLNNINKKVDAEVDGNKGKARVFNEYDGGGAKFEGKDGTASFIGVNEDTNGGIGAQIYDIDVAENKGVKIDVTKAGAYYTKGDESTKASSERDVESNELATKGDIAAEKARAEVEEGRKLDARRDVTAKAQVYIKNPDGTQTMGDLPEGSVVDTEMSDTSTNAVQNKVIKAYVDNVAIYWEDYLD